MHYKYIYHEIFKDYVSVVFYIDDVEYRKAYQIDGDEIKNDFPNDYENIIKSAEVVNPLSALKEKTDSEES